MNISQMFTHHRIVAGPLDRHVHVLQRFVRQALLIVRPRKAVQDVSIVALDEQRLFNEQDGLIEALSLLGIGVPEIVQRIGVIGLQLDRLFERLDHGIAHAELLIGDSQDKLQVFSIGSEPDPFFKDLHRLRVVLHFNMRVGQVERELRLSRHVSLGFFQERDRINGAALPLVDIRGLQDGIGIVGGGCKDRPIFLERFVEALRGKKR